MTSLGLLCHCSWVCALPKLPHARSCVCLLSLVSWIARFVESSTVVLRPPAPLSL